MNLLRSTIHGPILGYADTHPLADSSNADLAVGSHAPVHKWLGIPYAQAKRFERPTAPEQWTDVLKTQEFGSVIHKPPTLVELTERQLIDICQVNVPPTWLRIGRNLRW